MVPREHVLLLIRQSIGVLGPSLFEGWGFGVDEARSVGKRLLISDIPAHREQNPPEAIFFNPQDPGRSGSEIRNNLDARSTWSRS